jgi:hypothetical protein
VLREIFADRHAFTTSIPALNDERNDCRHGNARGTEFGRRFDMIPLDVHANVITGLLDASAFVWT